MIIAPDIQGENDTERCGVKIKASLVIPEAFAMETARQDNDVNLNEISFSRLKKYSPNFDRYTIKNLSLRQMLKVSFVQQQSFLVIKL